jgi:hypothetical protein
MLLDNEAGAIEGQIIRWGRAGMSHARLLGKTLVACELAE